MPVTRSPAVAADGGASTSTSTSPRVVTTKMGGKGPYTVEQGNSLTRNALTTSDANRTALRKTFLPTSSLAQSRTDAEAVWGQQDSDPATRPKRQTGPRRHTTRRKRKALSPTPTGLNIGPGTTYEEFVKKISDRNIRVEAEPPNNPTKPLYTKKDAITAGASLFSSALQTNAEGMARDFELNLKPTANPDAKPVYQRVYDTVTHLFTGSMNRSDGSSTFHGNATTINGTCEKGVDNIPLGSNAASEEFNSAFSIKPNILGVASGLIASTSNSMAGRIVGLLGIVASQMRSVDSLPIRRDTETEEEHAEFAKLKELLGSRNITIPTNFEHELLHLLAKKHGDYNNLDMHKVVMAAAELEHMGLDKHDSHHPHHHQDQDDRHKLPKSLDRDTVFHQHAQANPVTFAQDVKNNMKNVLGVEDSQHPHADISALCGLDQMLTNKQMMVGMVQDGMKSIEDLIKAGRLTAEQERIFRYHFLRQIKEKIKTDKPSAWADFLVGFSTGASEGPAGAILLDRSVRDIEEGRILSSLSAQQIQGYILASKGWRFMTQLFTEVMVFSALADLASAVAHSRADLCTYMRTIALIGMAGTPGEEGLVEQVAKENTELSDPIKSDPEVDPEDLEVADREQINTLTEEQKQKVEDTSIQLFKSRLKTVADTETITPEWTVSLPEELQNVGVLLGPEYGVQESERTPHQNNILAAIRQGNQEKSTKLYHKCHEKGLAPEETLLVLMEHSDIPNVDKYTKLNMRRKAYRKLLKGIVRRYPKLLRDRRRVALDHQDAVALTVTLIKMDSFDAYANVIQHTLRVAHEEGLDKAETAIYLAYLLELDASKQEMLTGFNPTRYAKHLEELQRRNPGLFETAHLNKLRCRRTLDACLPKNKADENDQQLGGPAIPEIIIHPPEEDVIAEQEVDGAAAPIEQQVNPKPDIPPGGSLTLQLIKHIEDQFAVNSIGIPTDHAVKMQQVAWSTNSVFGIRPVDRGVRTLIQEGYPTKDIRVKGKSSNWGPQNGFICIDQMLSKKEGNFAVIVKQNQAIQSGLDQGHFNKVPLTISDARIQELEALGSIKITERTTEDGEVRGGRLIMEAKADREGQSGQAHTFLTVPSHKPGENLVLYGRSNGVSLFYEPVEVVAEPNINEPVTADYDLFFVAGKVEDFGSVDQRSVSQGGLNRDEVVGQQRQPQNPGRRGSTGSLNTHVDGSDLSRAGSVGRVDILGRFNANQGKPLGAISKRVNGLMTQINKVLDRGENREMVHHGEDAGNPSSDMADNFPATFYLPQKMRGTYQGEIVTLEPVTVLENLSDYQKMVSVLKDNGYHFTDNKNWPKVRRNSFQAALDKFNPKA